MFLKYKKNLIINARKLRKKSTLSEVLLWKELRAGKFRGIKFNRQKPIGGYIADFYSKQYNLIIEIDGATHWNKEEYDKERQKKLERMGINFLRFEDRDVKNNLFEVLERLGEFIDNNNDATSPQPPSRRGTNSNDVTSFSLSSRRGTWNSPPEEGCPDRGGEGDRDVVLNQNIKNNKDATSPQPPSRRGTELNGVTSPQPPSRRGTNLEDASFLLPSSWRGTSGYTLLEIIVAVGIFVSLLLLSSGIFRYVMEAQRNALASQNVQESMRFAFESMSREIRTALGDHAGSLCDASPGDASRGFYKIYNTNSLAAQPDSGDVLYFRNLDSECVTYAVSPSKQLMFTRYNEETGDTHSFAITPDEIDINFLEFFVIDDEGGAFHSVQPRVTIVMEAEFKSLKSSERRAVKMQTTVSARYYE